uniref:MBD domain-containing protein n=1 Tax=Saccharum hybrid cultivar R570 TaxID=131158 RepID=A0A059Q0T3_9POAL|nr:hypothetical protein SHCRBa_016_K03_R_160 [Saccharum hybrid cultivar R570]
MDSCEGSDDYITQSKIVPAKSAALVDGKNEPAGEGLPDGWLKEYRPRKNQYGSRVKGDTFYIDPVNGYKFHSLKDVHFYLESGDISQCFRLPNKRKIGDLHTEGDQSHHTGKLSDHTPLDTADKSNRYDLLKGTNALGHALLNPKSGENAENVTLCKPDDINSIQREADQVEASEGKSIQSGFIEETPGEAKFVTRKGANVEEKPKEKKYKTKPVKGIAVPLRSSPRLAALKISQEANNTPRDGHGGTQADITNEPQPKQIQKPRRKTNSSVLPERKDGESTRSSAKNLPSVPNQTQGASFPHSSGDAGCQNAPAEAPVLRQQTGQGETSDTLSGSALPSLFQHVWSDPCLVFAFRTLLGDIPVLDDARAYQSSAYDGNTDYYLPPQSMNKNTAANWSASAYDGNRNHAQVNNVMPRSSDKFCGSGWFPPQ